MKVLTILVACEESQAVTKAFRALGHEAYSNDILECSGGHPEWHLQMDTLEALKLRKWDMIIGFPPCTHLAVSGAHLFKQKQADGRQQKAIEFFMAIANADCKYIAIENPVGIMSTKWRKPNQIFHPYMFGHPHSKKTCLWLKNLPVLKHTNVLELPETGHWENQTKDKQNKIMVDGKWIGYNDPRTASLRSKTYECVAQAMAEQWSAHVIACMIFDGEKI